MVENIKKKVAYYTRKYQTNDPFVLAAALGIEVAIGDIGSRAGCYMYLKEVNVYGSMKIWKVTNDYLLWHTN